MRRLKRHIAAEIRYGGVVPTRARSRRNAFLVGAALLAVALTRAARGHAEIDGQVFTSRVERLKLTIPKGWRASDLPSYPGVVLYLLRSQPEGRILVGSEPLRQQLYCSWPPDCRKEGVALEKQYACALQRQLDRQHNVGSIQAGPKENLAAGLPSVWFEYTDNLRYSRVALAVNARRAVTMVLTTSSVADRASHARAFDQALRSLHELSDDEASPATPQADTRPAGDGAAAAAAAVAAADAETADARAGGVHRLPLPLFDPTRPCP